MGTKRKTRSSHESLLLPIVPVNLVGAYSLPPYLPSSVSVPIVLCTLNSRRWNQTFGARWFSPVYVRTVCVNLVLYVGPVLYSVLILFLKIKATIRDCRKKFSTNIEMYSIVLGGSAAAPLYCMGRTTKYSSKFSTAVG